MNIRTTAMVAASCLLGACASVPPGPPPEVVELQQRLETLHEDSRIAANAQNELGEADAAVNLLVAENRHMDARQYEHHLYVADRLIQTAEAEGLARYAGIHAQELGAERDRLLAETPVTIPAAPPTAVAPPGPTAEMESLRADLGDLQPQQTEHGLVVTLGDSLFEPDTAQLRPGAERALYGLVRALADDPGASIEIDGHTDATGNPGQDANLSLRRAQAIEFYLASQGVAHERMNAVGLGADYPIASNDNLSGRLQNRRVEVHISVARQ